MHIVHQFDVSTLNWVKGEIDETLNQARLAFEDFCEDQDEKGSLDKCIGYLHQVLGTLEMVGLNGAAKFAGEVEQLALMLQRDQVKEREKAFEVLMRSILQLPDYLESLQAGHPDNPIFLLPLINELRHHRGDTRLSESVFFHPDLSVIPPAPEDVSEPKEDIGTLAKSVRRHYQSALLKLIRNEDAVDGLRIIAAVIHKLYLHTTVGSVRRWLWVCQSYVAGVRKGHISLDKNTKTLLGKIDQLIKLMIETGERGLPERHVNELTRALLYYIAHVPGEETEFSEIRKAFRLGEILPVDKTGNLIPSALSGFNAELKQTVSTDLMEELAKVKDHLDVFERGDHSDREKLIPLADGMVRIGETLTILHEDGLSESIKAPVDELREIIGGGKLPDDATMMGIASALLAVESALRDWGVVAPVEQADNLEDQVTEEEASLGAEAEHHRVVRQVMSEAKDELVLIRDAISQYVEAPGNRSVLDAVPEKLNQIKGSLFLLSYTRAAQVLESCHGYIHDKMLETSELPPDEQLDELADAMMSTEYYLEAFIENKVHPASALDVAEKAVAALGYPISVPKKAEVLEAETELQVSEAEPFEEQPPEVEEAAEAVVTEVSEAVAEITTEEFVDEIAEAQLTDAEVSVPEPVEVEEVKEEIEPAAVATVEPSAAVEKKPGLGDEIDDEILEIFAEEVEEELNRIKELLPRWISQPSDEEPLLEMRRSYHTLKGSGRLVGAENLGDFAWACENMLNRVIDGTVSHNHVMFDILEQSVEALPQLLEQFKGGHAPIIDVEMLIEAATDLSSAERIQSAEAVETPEVVLQEVETEAVATEMVEGEEYPEIDPVLLDIYANEVDTHVVAITEFVTSVREGGSSRVSEPLVRALHTLQGSSRMAGANDVGELFAVLERYIKALQAHHHTVDDESLSVLEESSDYVSAVVSYLLDRNKPLPEQSDIQQRADALYQAVQHLEEVGEAHPEAGLAQRPEVEAPTAEAEVVAEQEGAIELDLEGLEGIELEETPEVSEEVVIAEEELPELEEAIELDLEGLEGIELEEAPEVSEEVVIAGEQLPELDEVIELGLEGLEGIELEETPEVSEEVVTSEEELPELEEAIELDLEGLEGFELEQEAEAGGEAVESEVAEIEPVPEVAEPKEEVEAKEEQPPATAEVEEFDEELLEIFLEEAEEILDASEETLQAWVENPDDRTLVALLQRQLHTLKGGARMAGISEIGDLSHSLESTFEGVVEGRLKRSGKMMNLLQLAHDGLVTMLGQVRNHQPLIVSDDLIDKVNELARVSEGVAEVEETPVVSKPVEKKATLEEVIEKSSTIELGEKLSLHLQQMRMAERSWKGNREKQEYLEHFVVEVSALGQEASDARIDEIAVLTETVSETLQKVLDGHIAISEELFELLDSADRTLTTHLQQIERGDQLENPRPLVSRFHDLVSQLQTIADAEEARESAEREEEAAANRRKGARIQHEMVRVRADLLNNLVNYAGEVSIYRSRIEQEIATFKFNIDEMEQTISRFSDRLREFDIENEAQIESRLEEANLAHEDFDPLEFDRFTNIQQMSRSMMESLSDLTSIEEMLLGQIRETETLLLQQSRVNTELQESLMQTRMVPLVENAPRLRRLVRQTCSELGKQANLHFQGAEVKMDRNVVERMMAPMEHMLRNAIAHGIESKKERQSAGKPNAGSIVVDLSREGSEVIIRISDDGAGINLDVVRDKAIERGLLDSNATINDRELMQFILESGLSTADSLSQISGRGVGMDVVNSEIKQLGGILQMESERGKGSVFTIRLPLTLSVSRALLITASDETFAIPLLGIQNIERVEGDVINELMASETPRYRWLENDYELLRLSTILGLPASTATFDTTKRPLLLAQSGEQRIALIVDGLIGSREIVVKSMGPQLSQLQDLAGATILADGSVTLILDMPSLIRHGLARRSALEEAGEVEIEAVATNEEPVIMVVDDSITVRKVTERLLKRNEMKAITAKDGVDALTVLDEQIPDVMLLDIEMPRMDGFELATYIRNSERLKGLPIIMITSRTGEKHKQRALDIGVDIYMGKPFTESDLLENIEKLIEK